MGFLDNFLKKLGAKLATRYGIIPSGKYKDCHIALGNAPKEKVSVANSFSQVIILNKDEELARFNIAKDIEDIEYAETIQFPATGNDGYRCKITFADGNNCEVDLFPSKALVFYQNLNAKMREETLEFFKNTLNV